LSGVNESNDDIAGSIHEACIEHQEEGKLTQSVFAQGVEDKEGKTDLGYECVQNSEFTFRRIPSEQVSDVTLSHFEWLFQKDKGGERNRPNGPTRAIHTGMQ
jgi:hypothetical protein